MNTVFLPVARNRSAQRRLDRIASHRGGTRKGSVIELTLIGDPYLVRAFRRLLEPRLPRLLVCHYSGVQRGRPADLPRRSGRLEALNRVSGPGKLPRAGLRSWLETTEERN